MVLSALYNAALGVREKEKKQRENKKGKGALMLASRSHR
jgi:hypothetical protein